MASYGTIPVAAPSPEDAPRRPLDLVALARDRCAAALAACRPWRDLAPGVAEFGLPPSIGDAYLRIRTNASHFAVNYAVAALVVAVAGLIWHPVPLLVFAVAAAAWSAFFFILGGEPLVVLGREISNRTVLIGLSVATAALLLATDSARSILVSIFLGIAVVLAHAAVRKTEDLRIDEEGAVAGGWYSVVRETTGS